MAVVGGGAQAELTVVHERAATPVPEALDWPAAGGVPEVFTTAHDAMFTQAELKLGERLLVHGGAGGVGTAAVQLGRAAGAEVVATVRSEALRGDVEALGARVVAPDGFAELGPVRRRPGADRSAQPRRGPEGAGHGRPDRRDRCGGRGSWASSTCSP
jgi:NADPH:quinone reductase-like Zn-dependent oxidoreductase